MKLSRSKMREAVVINGVAGLFGFGTVFVATWFFPTLGMIWFVVACGGLLFSLLFSQTTLNRNLSVLIVTAAAFFAAAAFR